MFRRLSVQLREDPIATDRIPQVTFAFYDKLKPVMARFDRTLATANVGLLLLKALLHRRDRSDHE
ncbi:MAG: hypothetical protein JNK03_04170 [Nitrospira sp.]|nr:hypothetical protein [Nitrospira sp.]